MLETTKVSRLKLHTMEATKAKLAILMLLFFFAFAKGIDFEAASKDLRIAFKTINYHIYDNVQSDDPEENIKEAKRWLNLTASRSEDPDLINGLKLFTELPITLEEQHKCTPYSYKVLSTNQRATNDRAKFARMENFSPRRIDEIVHHYCLKHAKFCHQEIPKIVKTRYQSLDNATVSYVEAIATDWVNKTTEKKYPSYASYYPDDGYMETRTEVSPQARSRFVYKTLKALPVNDTDFRFLVKVVNKREGTKVLRKDKIIDLVQKYFVEPCRLYVKTLDLESMKNLIDFTDTWYSDDSGEYEKTKHLRDNYDNCKKVIETSEKGEILSKIEGVIEELYTKPEIKIEP